MTDNHDNQKIDEAVIALMYLALHDVNRAWKGFDWSILDRLYEKGWIADPKNKAKSVILTEEGLLQAARLFKKNFAKAKIPNLSNSSGY